MWGKLDDSHCVLIGLQSFFLSNYASGKYARGWIESSKSMINTANKKQKKSKQTKNWTCKEYVFISGSLYHILKDLYFMIMKVIFMCSEVLENIEAINKKINISLIISVAKGKHCC